MKKTYYEKKVSPSGKVSYVPVLERDDELWGNALPKGFYLLQVSPGSKSRRSIVNPDRAAVLAAIYSCEEEITDKLIKSSEMFFKNRSLMKKFTPAQKIAWENLIEQLGDEARYLSWPCAHDVFDEMADILVKASDKIFENDPSLRHLHDQLLFLAKLSGQESSK
jgi:hypothetical protein